jgi:hypothetical protein
MMDDVKLLLAREKNVIIINLAWIYMRDFPRKKGFLAVGSGEFETVSVPLLALEE